MPTPIKQTSRPSPVPTNGKDQSAVDRIRSIGFSPNDGIKLLLYGKSGTGKTTFWATFPKPILAIVCSGGKKPGELRSIDTPEYRKTVSQVTLKNSGEIRELLQVASNYGTVVLDHASGLQDMILAEILGLNELPAQLGWGTASREQYGRCALQCKEMFRALISLSINVVIVAQERVFGGSEESDSSGESVIAPTIGAGLIPSVTGWLNPACDYVCQTFLRAKMEVKKTTIGEGKQSRSIETKQRTGKVEYCLRTGPDETVMTKFRLPKGHELPQCIVDPDYDKLIELIQDSQHT